jgi:hypothetical protein
VWSRQIPFRVDIAGIIEIMGSSLYSRMPMTRFCGVEPEICSFAEGLTFIRMLPLEL